MWLRGLSPIGCFLRYPRGHKGYPADLKELSKFHSRPSATTQRQMLPPRRHPTCLHFTDNCLSAKLPADRHFRSRRHCQHDREKATKNCPAHQTSKYTEAVRDRPFQKAGDPPSEETTPRKTRSKSFRVPRTNRNVPVPSR